MQVKISQAERMITTAIKTKLAPILKGSPGCGKSQVVHQIANKYNLKLIDFRLSQCDPTDLLGFPQIVGNKACYIPMETFPLEGEPIPDGYSGWLLFFDELTSAVPAIQAAAYKIILDRMVGQHRLHKNVAIVAAGNLETDNAIVQPMSTALQSRMVHMELTVDVQEWTDWAASTGIHHHISDFIKFKPGNLFTFIPDHQSDTYACPRTWEFADRILKDMGLGSPDILEMLSGTISEGVAREFIAFSKIYKDLPSIAQIIAAPEKIGVPEEPSVLFAMTGSISHNITADNCAALLKYVSRLSPEFQVVCVRETVRRDGSFRKNPNIVKWVEQNAEALF